MHEGFLEETDKAERERPESIRISSNHSGKNERSLSEVLSEVLSKKDYDKVEKLIEFIEDHGAITPKEAEKICNKSSATVRRYLKTLVDTRYIKAQGNTSNLIYKVV